MVYETKSGWNGELQHRCAFDVVQPFSVKTLFYPMTPQQSGPATPLSTVDAPSAQQLADTSTVLMLRTPVMLVLLIKVLSQHPLELIGCSVGANERIAAIEAVVPEFQPAVLSQDEEMTFYYYVEPKACCKQMSIGDIELSFRRSPAAAALKDTLGVFSMALPLMDIETACFSTRLEYG